MSLRSKTREAVRYYCTTMEQNIGLSCIRTLAISVDWPSLLLCLDSPLRCALGVAGAVLFLVGCLKVSSSCDAGCSSFVLCLVGRLSSVVECLACLCVFHRAMFSLFWGWSIMVCRFVFCCLSLSVCLSSCVFGCVPLVVLCRSSLGAFRHCVPYILACFFYILCNSHCFFLLIY